MAKADLHTGIDIPPTQTVAAAGGYTLQPTAGTTVFPNSVCYFGQFTIEWQISFDGGNTWQGAGTSENEVFLTLSTPSSSGVIPYRTVAYLACNNQGATNADEAVVNTWGMFAGLNVCKWNDATDAYDIPLYYYRPGTDFSQNPGASGLDPSNPNPSMGSTTLLHSANGSARCGVWAAFLMQTLQLNGVVSHAIGAFPVGDYFYVDNWGLTDSSKPLPATPGIGSQFISANPVDVIFPNEMQLLPNPPGGQPSNYGAITSQDGHAGQNSSTPSQKIWGDHAFLQYTDSKNNVTYYDPSYGATYIGSTNQPDVTGEMNFQVQSLMCFGIYSSTNASNHALFNIFQPGTLNVRLTTLF